MSKTKEPKPKTFNPEVFLDKCLRELAAKGVDSTVSMSLAMNMMLEIMRLIIVTHPDAGFEPVRDAAAMLAKGFGKIASAKDALRVREIIDSRTHFGRKKVEVVQ